MPEWDSFHNREVRTTVCHPYHLSAHTSLICWEVLGTHWPLGPGLGDLQILNSEQLPSNLYVSFRAGAGGEWSGERPCDPRGVPGTKVHYSRYILPPHPTDPVRVVSCL